MQIGDQVQVRYSKSDSEKIETGEDWRIGTIQSFNDSSFELEFVENHGNKFETFPMSMFQQRDARLIPVHTFSSMFFE